MTIVRSGDYAIRALDAADVDAYVAHLAVHDRESGTAGDLPYGPYDRDRPQDPVEVRARALRRWSTPLDAPGWRRAWGLWLGTVIVGSAHLAGSDLAASLHRADFGIGIERPHRGRGWGARLTEAAITWARAQPAIDWIDLGVFRGNDRAHALYTSVGFVEVARVTDRFRVDGLSIDDIQMTLRVAAR